MAEFATRSRTVIDVMSVALIPLGIVDAADRPGLDDPSAGEVYVGGEREAVGADDLLEQVVQQSQIIGAGGILQKRPADISVIVTRPPRW